MPFSEKTIDAFVRANRDEYGDQYDQIRWATPPEAEAALRHRAALLSDLEGKIAFGCKGTKLDCRRLSPGCRVCGDGAWSCLFINGKCPCGCFYCPAEQTRIDTPTSQTIAFHRPAEYVRYLEKFNFKGASISGGEPFLTLPLAVSFISAIKKRFGPDFHVWLYTSGRFIDEDSAKRLRDAGLDEMRFNIGATGWQLTGAKKAVGVIPTVTVEIPAIPEAADRLKAALAEMADAGIGYLNLHQLRLTPYNFPNLVKRGYTFLHGEKATVLESELTALSLIHHAAENRIDLPINYCAFAYKHRFQMAAFHNRYAALAKKGHEDVTETGHIRDLWLEGPAEALARQVEIYRRKGHPEAAWSYPPTHDQLHIAQALWPDTAFEKFRISVAHGMARIRAAVSYRHPFVTVDLTRHKQVFIEKARVSLLREVPAGLVHAMAAGGSDAAASPESASPELAPRGSASPDSRHRPLHHRARRHRTRRPCRPGSGFRSSR